MIVRAAELLLFVG